MNRDLLYDSKSESHAAALCSYTNVDCNNPLAHACTNLKCLLPNTGLIWESNLICL